MNFTNNILSHRLDSQTNPHTALNQQSIAELEVVRQKIETGYWETSARACPVCTGEHFQTISNVERYALPLSKAVCEGCGLIMTNPDLQEENYTDLYRNHYRTLYLGSLVGTPADFFDEERWRGQAIRDFLKHSKSLSSQARILEIGCGSGGILSEFKKLGHAVTGVDFGAENLAFAKAKGIEVFEGGIQAIPKGRTFDLVIYSHVLEHIKDLNGELQYANSVLNDGGHLYIEVPGIKNVWWNTYQGDLLAAFHIAHIYDFSLSTLTQLMNNNGFELIRGDEFIRSVWKKGKSDANPKSDFVPVLKHLFTTEKHHKLIGKVSRLRTRIRVRTAALKGILIEILKRFGLAKTFKRLLG